MVDTNKPKGNNNTQTPGLPGVASKGPTLTPGQISDKAAAAAASLGSPTSGSSSKGIIAGTSLGIDPTTGQPIFNRDPLTGKVKPFFTAGYEQSYIKGLTPKDRAALQTKMFELRLYPEGFVPSKIVTQEDFDAVLKLMAVGEQVGKGDINDVIKLAQKDVNIKKFLQTGGYRPTATVNVTDTKEAASTLTNYFLDLFNEKPTKDEVKAYQTAINTRERQTKGAVGPTERNDIILSVANKRLSVLTTQAIAGDVTAKGVLDSGQLGKRVRELREAYADNGIPVSDKTLYKQVGQSLRSVEAYDNVLEEINQNAGLQWGQLATGLKPGQTMRSKLQPYISLKAQITGKPEDQINVSDMADVMNPDGTFKKTGEYKMMQYGSKDYLESDTYKQVVLNDTQAVLRNFGVM
jgi:hypothetical protein